MLSTDNAARQALAPRTNLLHTLGPQSKLTSFLQPNQKPKRKLVNDEHQPQKKRPRVEVPPDSDSEEETDGEYEDNDDVAMEDPAVIQARVRMRTPFISQSRYIASPGIHPRKFARMSSLTFSLLILLIHISSIYITNFEIIRVFSQVRCL